MRDQYAGDISDLLKFSLLRALAGNDRRVGVAWYYLPDNDGRMDGRHIEWQAEPAWQQLDPQVWAGLRELPERSVKALQSSSIWLGRTYFHAEAVPASALRIQWAEKKRTALTDANLVFLDPDNGLGSKHKHATYSEVQLLRKPGRAVVFISFPGRAEKHDILVRKLHERLIQEAGAERIVTLRTSVSVRSQKNPLKTIPRQRWFTIIDADAVLQSRAHVFAALLETMPRTKVHLNQTV